MDLLLRRFEDRVGETLKTYYVPGTEDYQAQKKPDLWLMEFVALGA